ncbi:phosphoglucosamine mutase [Mediannikoviicoccus vaginalis]|uniref:phosphoglucosamine mutase n=1 Tax=Mediannikoviicoccus vaginalis TaxID=2899727 RepID=UPI001F0136D4|nr:phosphoglucosamine mutase [Mediannikoviicoccus vaginalis]
MGRYFGTDGIRGVANSELTPELAYKLARASAYRLEEDNNKLIIIGKDTRISGDMLEAALVAGYTSMGFDVKLLGVIPTPAVAHLVLEYNAEAGIVISASHNSFEFNGIKYFGSDGYKLPDEVEADIEDLIDNYKSIEERPVAKDLGRVIYDHEAASKYKEYLEKCASIKLDGYKVALDCGNGATYKIAPEIFKELGAEVISINTEPNGVNINDKCGSTHPEDLQKLVVENNCNIGFAYDGDGDRLITVDEKGNLLDGDHFLAILSMHLKEIGKLENNGVVGTVMTNIGLGEFCNTQEINLIKASVGDRYVLEKMLQEGYCIGGEQSGHIIFKEHATTGDGILSSLMLMQVVVESSKKVSELNDLMTTYPQVLVNAKVENEFKKSYETDEEIQEEIKRVEAIFEGQGRVLIRPSGTEPLVRVMIEGKDLEILEREANKIALLIESKFF